MTVRGAEELYTPPHFGEGLILCTAAAAVSHLRVSSRLSASLLLLCFFLLPAAATAAGAEKKNLFLSVSSSLLPSCIHEAAAAE